ncbi:MAG TPA: hypothetical protein VFT59_02825 [Candidatus Saccharimonadales bacterium]|nr:hypothetical protein [Candidatus Saccharimonadales bacterium]
MKKLHCRLNVLLAQCEEYTEQRQNLIDKRSTLRSQRATIKDQVRAVKRILKHQLIDEVTRQQALALYAPLEVLQQEQQRLIKLDEELTREENQFYLRHSMLLSTSTLLILQRAMELYASIIGGVLPQEVDSRHVVVCIQHKRLDFFYGGVDGPLGEGHGHVVLNHHGRVVFNRQPSV